jgi:hypothetical protein
VQENLFQPLLPEVPVIDDDTDELGSRFCGSEGSFHCRREMLVFQVLALHFKGFYTVTSGCHTARVREVLHCSA